MQPSKETGSSSTMGSSSSENNDASPTPQASSSADDVKTLVMTHGWLQNGKVFEEKSLAFLKQIKSTPIKKFSFPDAPLIAELNQEQLEYAKEDREFYRTWIKPNFDRSVYGNWRSTMMYLINYIKTKRIEGNAVDGILGFSQGAMIVSTLSMLISLEFYGLLNREHLPKSFFETLNEDDDDFNFEQLIQSIRETFFERELAVLNNGQSREIVKCNLKFVIIVGGFKAKSHQVQQVMKVLLDNGRRIGGCLKSLHIYGMNDEVITPAMSQSLANDWFDPIDTIQISHPKKHILPTGEGFDKEGLRSFIISNL